MDALLAPSPLGDALARSMDVVRRLRVEAGKGRSWSRQKRVDQIIAEAQAALASGDPFALKPALLSVELLCFELCEG